MECAYAAKTEYLEHDPLYPALLPRAHRMEIPGAVAGAAATAGQASGGGAVGLAAMDRGAGAHLRQHDNSWRSRGGQSQSAGDRLGRRALAHRRAAESRGGP